MNTLIKRLWSTLNKGLVIPRLYVASDQVSPNMALYRELLRIVSRSIMFLFYSDSSFLTNCHTQETLLGGVFLECMPEVRFTL